MKHDDDPEYVPKFPKNSARRRVGSMKDIRRVGAAKGTVVRTRIARRVKPKPMSKSVSSNIPLRAAVRREVIHRDEGRCRVCRTLVWFAGHAHEILYRSRGGDPHDPRNIITVCAACHSDEHLHNIRITGDAINLTIERLRP